MKTQPPKRALKFLRWFCHEDYLEEIEGDLIEIFEIQAEDSQKKANWNFTWSVIRYFRPEFIKSFQTIPLINSGMYKNYLKIAWRNLLKQKQYAFINISGLAVGLTCFLLIFLYVQHELSYDQFYSNTDKIYRVYQQQSGNEYLGSDYFAVTPAGLASALKAEIPEVAQATSLEEQTALLGREESYFYETGLRADTHFFDVFPFKMVRGNPYTALNQAKSLVLTESLAQKIFGNIDPIGKSITYKKEQKFMIANIQEQTLTVTGVMVDPPVNSSLKFSYLASILANTRYVEDVEKETWDSNNYHTFFTLADHTTPLGLPDKLSIIHEKYVDYGESFPYEGSYYVQPLTDLHLETHLNFDIGLKGNPRYIQIFSLIAWLVLFLACINYVNLALARSIKRAGEVSLRKVVGASRFQLITQFISESILITVLAFLLALGLTDLILPVFSSFLERTLSLNLLENKLLLPGLLGLVLGVGILSGSYPAFLMSSLSPATALKGNVDRKFSNISFQRWLMVGQYAASVILIIGSVVIYQQFQFIQNKELGYNKNHIVTFLVKDEVLSEQYKTLKNEWLRHPQVVLATASTSLPANITSQTIITDKAVTKNALIIYQSLVDYDYAEVFGIKLIAGRFFSQDYKTDAEEAIVLNETAAKALGWSPEEAIGKQFIRDGKETIVGVVQDFHMHSLHSPIAPLMLQLNNGLISYISVKINPNNLQETIMMLETTIKPYTSYPIEYQFLDNNIEELYRTDRLWGKMFSFFTLLSILIAALGLFGMAAFRVKQRTKEIGIRKTLGASVNSIVSLLSQDFLKLVLLGYMIAIPIAWYAMQQWLADYAYQVELSWWMFALAGLFAMTVALLTISSQSIKAACSNPVKCLRSE
ncbi:ABC transporter permease [Chondrinema litorale]|uniref:ABC transporter permease n=1 Tax=Chondrinema litorale TaxID=2994555 RepID=UPI002543EA65|nr:ABC transporter permease [Chondrinema litorale]UZR96774.1 ABC transporter permease [Chondrinema litorale]